MLDGVYTNGVNVANFTPFSGGAQFTKLAGLYQEAMVSFMKIKYVPYEYGAFGTVADSL